MKACDTFKYKEQGIISHRPPLNESLLMCTQTLSRSLPSSVFISRCLHSSLASLSCIAILKRLVYLDDKILTTIFLHTLFRVNAAWAVKTDFAQTIMRNATDTTTRDGEVYGATKGGTIASRVDELCQTKIPQGIYIHNIKKTTGPAPWWVPWY